MKLPAELAPGGVPHHVDLDHSTEIIDEYQ
jgi:hypothetical protein